MFAKIINDSQLRNNYSKNKLRPFDNTILEDLYILEATASQDYFDAFVPFEMKKNDFLLKENEICNKLWFIEKGYARQFIFTPKDEITTDFYFPSEIITLYSSYIFNSPSMVNIQLLTDSVGYLIHWETFEKLYNKYPILLRLERIASASFCSSMGQRMHELLALTSTERYEKLMNENSYMLQHLTLKQIASYLGMAEETLSRIRNNIKNK